MITLLSRLFIKNKEQQSDFELRHIYGMLCSMVGISLNILLFCGKLLAGVISGSIAITADAFNNLSDAGSSLITLIGFKLAAGKPDEDHPFGHGRVEYISGLFVSIAILLMGIELLKSSVNKILHPSDVKANALILVILICSILVKLYMSYYNHSIGKKIDSAAMKATATDSISDVFATTTVLICTIITHFTGLSIDGYCGVLVGLLIVYAGFQAAKDTISPLLGQAPSKEFVDQIESLVMAHEELLGVHDLIVHDYGPGRLMISLHAEVPATGDMMWYHDIIDNVEQELNEKLNCLAVIHMDPVIQDDAEITNLKEELTAIINQIDLNLSFHDFRIVKGHTHTNILFDLLVPYNFHMEDGQLITHIRDKMRELHDNYYILIKIDKNFVANDKKSVDK